MTYALYLDDERDPSIEHFAYVCRSVAEAVACVEQRGFPLYVSFDHDLGEGPTGYDFAKWLVERDLDHNDMPKGFTFNVHSANPVGRRNIEGLLERYLEQK